MREQLIFEKYPRDTVVMDRVGMNHLVDTVKETLGAASWKMSFGEGIRLQLEEAIALGLGRS